MKIVALGCTHGHKPEVPDGDVLIHTGDLFSDTYLDSACWLQSLPHKYKILVPGNHDRIIESNPTLMTKILGEMDVTLLINGVITIDEVKFYGSPYQPEFNNWAFNRTAEQLVENWKKIPETTDVLVTHCPPWKILDRTVSGHEPGCESLHVNVMERVKPKIHVFSHIHEAQGRLQFPKPATQTRFFNCSVCDENYNPVNKPWLIEYYTK